MAEYRGKEVRLRKPRKIPGVTPSDKKFTVYVRDPKSGKVKMVHFGATGYGHNYSREARASFLARMKGVRNAQGKPAWLDPLSPAFWSVRHGWAGPGKRKLSPPK